jgi:hypothetical protein
VSITCRRSLKTISHAAMAAATCTLLVGCNPEGTGTVKVSPSARSSIEPEPKSTKPLTSKQAKVKQLEEEAKKKDPKRF